MLYGLSCTPSVLQCFINDMLRDMLGKVVIAYINEILIYSLSQESNVTHVKRILSCLLEKKLYIKGEKCKFHIPTLSFLGYIINMEGIILDDTKVRAVTEWPTPCTVKDLEHFLGFANFYGHFIRGFSSIATPLMALLRKGHRKIA